MGISEKAKDLFQAAAEETPSVLSALFLDGIAGSIAPGVVSTMLAYQQKRQERVYTRFMEEVRAKMDVIDARLGRLSRDALLDFKEKYFGMVSDYVLEEVQEEKVKLLAQGFANLAGMEHVKEDFVLTYYDTLRDLRMHDVAILRYKYDADSFLMEETENYWAALKRLGLDEDQGRSVFEKLERLGLITTRRDQKENDLYANILAMQEYLENLSKGKKAKLKNLKKLERRDSYRISKYGRQFVEFFMKDIDE